MAIERCYSLRQAAALLKMGTRTLKTWLRTDLGIVLPAVRRGSRLMLRESDLERLIDRRCGTEAWMVVRRDQMRERLLRRSA